MSLIFKKGAITWTNGTFLSAEHLKDERNFLISQMRNMQFVMSNHTHIESVKFNEVALNRNSLEITCFEGMMNNMQYIEYDANSPTTLLENGETSGKIYEIKEDLTQYSKLIMERKGLLFYLIIDGEYEITDSIIDSMNNSAMSVTKTIPKLKLIPETLLSNKINIPVCRIIRDESGLAIDTDYMPPTVAVKPDQKIYDIIVNLTRTLRSSLLEKAADYFSIKKIEELTVPQRNSGLYYNMIMPNVLNLESAINSFAHPKEVFYFLQNILGSVSLLKFTHLPSSRVYNHNDIFTSLSDLVNDIMSINQSMKKEGEKSLFNKQSDGTFTQDIPQEIFLEGNSTYLVLEMKNETERSNITSWIEEARICGDNFLEQIKINRIRGIERAFKNVELFGNNMFIVELNINNSKYINLQSKELMVFNHFSSYEPVSISLYWRNGIFT